MRVKICVGAVCFFCAMAALAPAKARAQQEIIDQLKNVNKGQPEPEPGASLGEETTGPAPVIDYRFEVEEPQGEKEIRKVPAPPPPPGPAPSRPARTEGEKKRSSPAAPALPRPRLPSLSPEKEREERDRQKEEREKRGRRRAFYSVCAIMLAGGAAFFYLARKNR